MSKSYTPDRGDIVWLSFNPQAGHEQAGHRPALVLSPKIYNACGLRLMLCCPITSAVKGYPFETKITGTSHIFGVILTDQIKSFDWVVRNATFIERLPDLVMADVAAKQQALLFPL